MSGIGDIGGAAGDIIGAGGFGGEKETKPMTFKKEYDKKTGIHSGGFGVVTS
jgi:hypothetical protein